MLTIFGMIIMVLDPLLDEKRSQQPLGTIALVGSLAALVATWFQAQYPGPWILEHGAGRRFSVFFHFLVIAITTVVILTSFRVHGSAGNPRGRILRV